MTANGTIGKAEGQPLKRKATQDQHASIKKARYRDDTEYRSSEDSSAESDNEGSIADNNQVDTPLTPISPKTFPRFPSELKTHLCTYPGCAKAFNRPAKLAEHKLSHTNSRPFICPHRPCNKDFVRQSHLSHHVKSAHSNVRDYVCEWEGCTKSFLTATRLKRHHAAHQGREKFRCSVLGCGQTFRKHATLQKHRIVAHDGGKPFSCELQDDNGNECGQGFDTAGRLHSHQGRVHGGKRFWCSICVDKTTEQETAFDETLAADEAGFATYAKMQEHIKIRHPPECSQCGIVCCSQRELKSHLEVAHGALDVDERKTHLCPEPDCGRAFTKKWNLNVHIQSAHNAKKYVCGEVPLEALNRIEGWDGANACGRGLSTKGSLESHIRTAHIGQGQKRRAKKSKTIPDTSEHTLLRLTGAGYEEESGRNISCPLLNCDFRFCRGYDLQVHLTSRHGRPEEVAKALSTGVSNDASCSSAWGDGIPADLMHDIDPRDWHMMDTNDSNNYAARAIRSNGQFWLGGDINDDEGHGDDTWFRDEMDMRMLIDGEDTKTQGSYGSFTTLDPALCE
ncbi:MAG: hypothetical protein Q9174_003294 [Haloplaca sp. 1 TL-2023]